MYAYTYVSIELADEAGEVAVLEESGEEVSGELRRLPHHEPRPLRVPGNHLVRRRILHQHVRLHQERRRRRLPHHHILHQTTNTTTTTTTHFFITCVFSHLHHHHQNLERERERYVELREMIKINTDFRR